MKTPRFFVPPHFGAVHQRFIMQMREMFSLRGAPRPMFVSHALLGRFAQRNKKDTEGGGALIPTARTLRRGLQALFAKLGECECELATATDSPADGASAAPSVTAPDDRYAAAVRSLLAHPERRRDTVRRLAKAAQRDLLAVHRSCGALCTPLRRGSSSTNGSPTGRHTKNVWSQLAVQEAQDTVERSKAQVLELELTCAALNCKVLNLPPKTKIEYVLSRWKRIDSTVKQMHRKTAHAVYDSVSTVEEAKVELKEAERKLKEAERKLENAKAELKEAKVELEIKLEKAKPELPVAKLAPCVETALSCGQLRIASLSAGAIGKAQGMVELAGELAEKLPSLGSIDKMQETIAFVLWNSSGVGKTFFSLAAAQLLSKSLKGLVGTLYLGFNCGVPLQPDELEFLQQAPSYESVQLVLLRRLLIQLECLLACNRKPRAQRGSPVPFTFDEYGLQHMVQMEENFLTSLPLLAEGPASITAATKKALGLLTAAQKAYQLSHLMLVIDEGQTLDTLIPPDSSKQVGGARYALRWTRELQLAARNAKCGLLVFGLMTGINPKTSLADQTAGTNHQLSHMPMTPDDFKKLTKVALEKETQRKNEISRRNSQTKMLRVSRETLLRNVAASYFPDARALGRIKIDDRGSVPLPRYDYANRVGFDEDVRQKLVLGALAGIPIDSTDWERTIPSAWTKNGFRFPCPSYAMMVGLLRSIHSTLPTNMLTVRDCYEFEAIAAEALQLLIWARGEASPRAKSWNSMHNVMNGIFPFRTGAFRSKVMSAFPTAVNGFSSEYPADAKSMYYPSSNSKSHTDAFAVGEKSPPLADTFQLHTNLLDQGTDGCGLFFRCGGIAPMDFVILHKTSNTKWQLTLADSKHTSNNSENSTAREMANKGDDVFRYLAQQLKKAYGVRHKG